MKVAFVDVETTGLDPETDEIIGACVMIWDDQTGGVVASWSSRFMPHGPCGLEAAKVNGYDPEVWAQNGAPFFTVESAAELGAILKQGEYIAGSTPSFDVAFLKAAFRRVRQPWPTISHRLIDVCSLAMPLVHAGLIEKRGLADVARFLGLGEQRHNAPDDVALSIQVYERLAGVYCDAALGAFK